MASFSLPARIADPRFDFVGDDDLVPSGGDDELKSSGGEFKTLRDGILGSEGEEEEATGV